MTKETHDFYPYALSDRYARTEGTVFLTGTQALVRIMLDQARRDKQQGLNTAGFISGYRGSPLGAVDLELWRARDVTKDNNITFMPAVNEDLGATAVLGAQQAVLDPHCEVEGVFSMWYGKGPGVDRSGDALRHGNAYGSSPKGGVLVVAGDDHGCVSSSMPHQSDVAFMTWMMPTLNPANVGEFLEFGAYGLALSRFSGTWVGFKAISETVESGQSVALQPDRAFTLPQITPPPGGLHVRRSDMPSPEIETRLQHKLSAVEAFVEANPIDRRIYNLDNATFGIVTTGKGHLDLMEALRLLGLDEANRRPVEHPTHEEADQPTRTSSSHRLDVVRPREEPGVVAPHGLGAEPTQGALGKRCSVELSQLWEIPEVERAHLDGPVALWRHTNSVSGNRSCSSAVQRARTAGQPDRSARARAPRDSRVNRASPSRSSTTAAAIRSASPAGTRTLSRSSVRRSGIPPTEVAIGTRPHDAASSTLTGMLSTWFVFKNTSCASKAAALVSASR